MFLQLPLLICLAHNKHLGSMILWSQRTISGRGLTLAHVCPSLPPRYLPIASGTSLRAFLSEALNCDPMRVSKKYFGDARLSRQSFVPAGSRAPLPLVSSEDLAAAVDASQVATSQGRTHAAAAATTRFPERKRQAINRN